MYISNRTIIIQNLVYLFKLFLSEISIKLNYHQVPAGKNKGLINLDQVNLINFI